MPWEDAAIEEYGRKKLRCTGEQLTLIPPWKLIAVDLQLHPPLVCLGSEGFMQQAKRAIYEADQNARDFARRELRNGKSRS